MSASADVVRDYALPRDDDGNLLSEGGDGDTASTTKSSSTDGEEDLSNLPDFGEYQKEMDELRKQREKEQEKRRQQVGKGEEG